MPRTESVQNPQPSCMAKIRAEMMQGTMELKHSDFPKACDRSSCVLTACCYHNTSFMVTFCPSLRQHMPMPLREWFHICFCFLRGER